MGRPRKTRQRFEIPGQGRYLTFSCQHRLPLFQSDSIKDVFVERLKQLKSERPFSLGAWVIMPEHVHLLVIPSLPEFPVPELLRALKRPVAERVIHRWRQLKAPILERIKDKNGKIKFWLPGGGYDRNIFSPEELHEKIEYIHANPVRRGLVDQPVDWKWSSARWYSGYRDGEVPIDPIV